MLELKDLFVHEMNFGEYWAKPVSIGDYDDIFSLMSNDLVRGMSAQETLNETTFPEWWKMRADQRALSKTQNWVVRNSVGEMIGLLTAKNIENNRRLWAEIGYSFLPENWGKGLATSLTTKFVDLLFSDFKFNHVIAQAASTNLASNKVLLKCGFQFQRSFFEGIIFQGKEVVLHEYIKNAASEESD